MSQEKEYPYGATVTMRAARPDYPIVGCAVNTAGLLLYAYIYEARWAGLKTTEICPRWKDLPQYVREGWEERAKEIAELAVAAQPEPWK